MIRNFILKYNYQVINIVLEINKEKYLFEQRYMKSQTQSIKKDFKPFK